MELLLTLAVTTGVIFLALKIFRNLFGKSGKVMSGPGFLETIRGFVSHINDPHNQFIKWSDKYGNIFSCNLGLKKLVILNNSKTIREAFANPHVQGRPEIAPGNPFRLPKNGIARNENESWALQRRVSLRHLKNFGFGTGGIMEKLIMEEIMELTNSLDDSKGKDVCIKRQFFFPTMNVVWIVMAGLRLTNDPADQKIKQLFLDFFHCLEKVASNPFIALIPNLVDMAPWIPAWKNYVAVGQDIRDFIGKLMEDHKRGMEESVGDAEDFIYAYLKDNCLVKDSSEEGNTYDPEAVKQLEAILIDFVMAGFETTSTQLEWVMYHMIENQECQIRIHEELDRIIGKNRLPSLADRPKLPYTEACILESMRITPILPIGLPHETTADTTVCGQPIPKGTTVLSNLYAAHHDPVLIKDHETFRPERFLSEDGTTVTPHPFFIPFSVGKRFCLGEFVAKDSMFMLVTGILLKFHLKPPTNWHDSNEGKAGGLLSSPGNFYGTYVRR